MENTKNPNVTEVFDSYPQAAKEKMLFLRGLVFEAASENGSAIAIEETIKWGEPSYLSPQGSTVRMAWKASYPEQYVLYFHCQTTLVDTFKELYGDELTFEGNRAIVFPIHKKINAEIVKHCIFLALTYHQRKHLPLLGA